MSEKLQYIYDAHADRDVPVVVMPDDRRIAIKVAGPDRGTPIIGFHGNPGSKSGPWPRDMWLHLLGIRLISFDRPGFGMSSRQPGRQIKDTADDVAAIANVLGIERFGVHGRSGGVPHALGCAALIKDRVANAGLMVGVAPREIAAAWDKDMCEFNKNTHGQANLDPAELEATLMAHAEAAKTDRYSLLKFLEPNLFDADKNVTTSPLRSLIARAHTEGLAQNAAGWVDDVIAINDPWGFDLSDITAPTILWHGEHDPFAPPEHARIIAQNVPNAQLVIHPNASHFTALEYLPQMFQWQRNNFSM